MLWSGGGSSVTPIGAGTISVPTGEGVGATTVSISYLGQDDSSTYAQILHDGTTPYDDDEEEEVIVVKKKSKPKKKR